MKTVLDNQPFVKQATIITKEEAAKKANLQAEEAERNKITTKEKTEKEEPKTPNPITQAIKDTITHIATGDIKTTFDEIKNKWNNIIEEISKKNHSLSFILLFKLLL